MKQSDDWYVYPKPTLDVVYVSFEEDFEYRIVDITGRCLNKSISYDSKIDLTSFTSGIYFLSVSRNGKLPTIRRFVTSR